MTFYQNSIIYKLKHNLDYDDLNIYIGSTSNFKNRKYCHKSDCNNKNRKNYNFKVYQYIRDNGNWDEWVMIPIEKYSCNDKKELEIRERHHIDLLRPTLNMCIPARTDKEYYEDNKEYYEKYYEDNKEKIKEYYENNKEKINEKARERKKEKVICDHCGCEMRKDCLKQHQKTKKCLNFKKD
tara:strand:- start:110 stop:655 length:546 start_codon:yes stop_codon:yes gene_type:complete